MSRPRERIAARCRHRYGRMVVAIMTADGGSLFNPEPGTTIEAGSTPIILGEPDDLRRFAVDAG